MTALLKKPVAQALIVSGLAVSVAIAGCTIPLGGASVSKETQTASIKESVSALKGSIKSLAETTDSLRSVSAVTTNPAAVYRLSSLYRVLGSSESNGLTVNWNDSTGQLTSITGPDTHATFSFSGAGSKRRTAQATLLKSPDGTTGSGELEVEASTWNASSNSSEGPQFWYNEMPLSTSVSYFRAKIALTPKGKAADKVELTAGAENFQTFDLPGMSTPVPTRVYAKGFIPKLQFDHAVDLKKAGSTQLQLTWNGQMAIDTEKNGRQDWKVLVTGTGDSNSPTASKIDFTLENTSQKFKLNGTALPKNDGGMRVTGKFTSTEGGHELATLSFDPATDTAPVITYADGSTDMLRLD